MEFDETSVLLGCIAGDDSDIEKLITQYKSGVFNLTFSLLNDLAEANEATQDTFISALTALPSYQDRSTLKAWLYRIAVNNCRNRLRKRKILQRLNNALEAIFRIQVQKFLSPEENLIEIEQDAGILSALSTLGEKHRLPIILRYFDDLSIADIARILKTNEGTIHSRLHVGRERLRLQLEKQSDLRGE